MRSGKWYFQHIIIIAVAIGGFTGSGCNTNNGIDNNNVVRTPYGLYFSDRLGALYNTNDGKAYKLVFPLDGVTDRAITTSGPNVLFVKYNLHVSADNGANFNPARINSSTLVTPAPQPKWQSMILDVPSHQRIYLASTSPTAVNGVMCSPDNGITWETDPATVWGGVTGVSVQSFAQLKNGNLYALDNSGPRIFERVSLTAQWVEKTMVTPLPAGRYFLSHFNNALIAADVTGAGGIFYSNNGGVDWSTYAGIPNNQEIFSVAAPLEQVLLAGTDSAGIYRLVGNTFQPSNNGLEPFTKVYGIVGKWDTYKNNIIKQYVYIATSKGLFRSEDLGQNWTLVRAGDIRALF